MNKLLQKYFIPTAENNFHPHILHTKRTIFYGVFFSLMKILIFVFVLLLPAEVFVLPDVLAEEQKQIISLTNELRQKNNRDKLAISVKLDLSSQRKADDMAKKKYFAHTNKNKKSLANWLSDVNYDYEVAGENLAVGFNTAEEIIAAWQKSPSHYANLLDSDFKDIGVGLSGGVFNGEPTVYIAQHFATPVLATKVSENTVYSITENAKDINIKQHEIIPTNNSSVRRSVLAEKIIVVRQSVPMVLTVSGSTPVEKYVHARSVLGPITRIFDVSQGVFLAAMIFFIGALLIKIFVQIRQQHPKVIFQTAALILLLFVFWKF